MLLNGQFIKPYFYVLCLISLITAAQENPTPPADATTTGISVTHDQYYCLGSAVPIVESVSITDPDNPNGTLQELFIQISQGYENGEDELIYTGSNTAITANWNANQGLMTLTGTATFAAYEEAVLNVVFTTIQSVYTSDRSISISLGAASYLPSNGHYYQYISDPGINWREARDAAAGYTYFGIEGYLVTITSEDEAQLVGDQNPGTGWIGATDEVTEGIWLWATGPETGMVFWEGAANGGPPNDEYSFWNCGEPNNFQGNEDYAHITNRGVAGCGNIGDPEYYGAWNDLPLDAGTTDPSNPYYPQGYIVEYGGLDPNEPDLQLSASSVINMPQVELGSLDYCGAGTYELVLQGNADNFYWYDSPSSNTPFFIGDTYTTFLSSSETYWISPRYGGCTQGGIEPFFINVFQPPTAIDQSVVQCDNEGDTDGITEFNLSVYDEQVADGDLTNRVVIHYEDAGLSERIDSESYTNLFDGQVVYALVIDTQTECTNTAEIELNVTVPDSGSAYLEECDDEPEDGFTEFDLSLADEQVIQDPLSGVTTAYYETYNDALLQMNELPTIYRNTVPNNQIIYVRLQEGNNCFGINEVELQVRPLPELEPDETVYYCLNAFPEPILIDGGVLNDTPNNYYYNWSTGETTIAIEVNEPGTYSVEVSEVVGCTKVRTISVLASEIATIESVEVETSGDLSTLTVLTSGTGAYEYALDDITGPYQESNVFENVSAGVKKVYVRDVNGDCGIAETLVSVVGYPKFFTPNGDGQNDVWRISGFNTEFPFIGSVEVFDRYGKLLAVLSASTPQWDGTYGGSQMPSSDYWFIATLEDGERITGHFSLKR